MGSLKRSAEGERNRGNTVRKGESCIFCKMRGVIVFRGVTTILYVKGNRATKARFPFQRENNKGVDVMYSRACVASEA